MSFLMALNRKSLAGISLVLAMLACNVPGVVEPALVGDQTVTVTAVTAQEPTRDSNVVSPTVTVSVTPNITATPNGSLSATITPTYSVPMLIVQEPTNCRTGPGEEYKVVFTYLAGKELEIVGRYEPGNFWLVKSSESSEGTCWLWGQYVEVTGSYWVVPSVTPPPTATNPPPRAPAIERYEFLCSSVTGKMEITIIWVDRSNNETGYRIIRNGELAADLPADSTTYTDSVDLTAGQSASYRIEVFNASGSESSSTINVTC
jgi:hypothetical protein